MEESTQLAELLNEFQDVFAKPEFDLGHFSEIEHSIDTGQVSLNHPGRGAVAGFESGDFHSCRGGC